MIKNKMNPIVKNDNLRLVGALALALEIIIFMCIGVVMPEGWNLLAVSLIMLNMMFYVRSLSKGHAVLDADELKLVLRDYPELRPWVESSLGNGELITLNKMREVISENAFEEVEMRRIARENRLLEEQRKAIINSDIRNP